MEARKVGDALHFQRTISWDSVVAIIVSVISAAVSIGIVVQKVNGQDDKIAAIQANVEKSVNRVEQSVSRVESQAKERSDRIEGVLRDQNKFVQDFLLTLRK
jgi:hypothetical protein